MSKEQTAGSTESLFILSTLADIETGVHTSCPPHLTWVPWIEAPAGKREDIRQLVQRTARRYAPPEIIGQTEGELGSYVVRHVGRTGLLQALHDELKDGVLQIGELAKPEHCGAGYLPHVSRQESGWIEEGQRYKLCRLQLGGLAVGNKWRIIYQYGFRGKKTTA